VEWSSHTYTHTWLAVLLVKAISTVSKYAFPCSHLSLTVVILNTTSHSLRLKPLSDSTMSSSLRSRFSRRASIFLCATSAQAKKSALALVLRAHELRLRERRRTHDTGGAEGETSDRRRLRLSRVGEFPRPRPARSSRSPQVSLPRSSSCARRRGVPRLPPAASTPP